MRCSCSCWLLTGCASLALQEVDICLAKAEQARSTCQVCSVNHPLSIAMALSLQIKLGDALAATRSISVLTEFSRMYPRLQGLIARATIALEAMRNASAALPAPQPTTQRPPPQMYGATLFFLRRRYALLIFCVVTWKKNCLRLRRLQEIMMRWCPIACWISRQTRKVFLLSHY